MIIIKVIVIIVFCAVASIFIYGMYLLEHDRHRFKKRHGIDPKYHGWKVDENDKDDTNQDK